jgi:hypothetical protein
MEFMEFMELYHISLLNVSSLKPRIPDNNFTRNGYENSTIPRICFSNTIDGCLAAIADNIKGATYLVYMPIIKEGMNIIGNEEIIDNNYVPDAILTGETWITELVNVRCVGKIYVDCAIDEPKKFKIGDKYVDAYFWNWRWIE